MLLLLCLLLTRLIAVAAVVAVAKIVVAAAADFVVAFFNSCCTYLNHFTFLCAIVCYTEKKHFKLPPLAFRMAEDYSSFRRPRVVGFRLLHSFGNEEREALERDKVSNNSHTKIFF